MNRPAKDIILADFNELNLAAAREIVLENMTVDPTALLRRIHGISITGSQRIITAEYVTHTVRGQMGDRFDEGTGAAMLSGLFGVDWANAIKAAETQAKRRLTSSLLGYGFQGSKEDEVPVAGGPAQEPTVPEMPAVNNKAAEVVADTRTPELLILPNMSVPQVSEATLAKMHVSQQKLDVPTTPQTEAPPVAPKPAPAANTQVGFFDEEPLAAPPGVTSTVAPEPVMTPVPPTPSNPLGEALEPAPVQDIVVEKPVTDKPTKIQYQGFTTRCTKLVRDVLPKAGKDAGALLLPYMRKVLGTNELQNGNVLVWEETLAKLEAAPNAAALLAIIKGGK